MKLTTIISAFYLFCLLCIQPVHADGGFWLPTQIQGKVHRAMKNRDCALVKRYLRHQPVVSVECYPFIKL